jgi:hypothetical protein
MGAPITNDEAVRRHPELQDLVPVREAGWCFRPIQGEVGELERIAGSYHRQLHGFDLHIRPHPPGRGVQVSSNQRAIPCTCSVHGSTPGSTNLVVRRTGDSKIVLDPMGFGASVIALDEAAANQLFDALGKWLG